MAESTGNSNEEPVISDIHFKTVTDLIDFYKVTSDKGKGNQQITEYFKSNGLTEPSCQLLVIIFHLYPDHGNQKWTRFPREGAPTYYLSKCCQNCMKISGWSRIFPRGVRQLPIWDYFTIFLPKTAWKWKNLDLGGGTHPWRPLRSANENDRNLTNRDGWEGVGTHVPNGLHGSTNDSNVTSHFTDFELKEIDN